MIKRILVGLAGTTYTPVAIERAITLAKAHGAELTGVTVLDPSRVRRPGREGPPAREDGDASSDRRIAITQASITQSCRAHGFRVCHQSNPGDPKLLLLAAATLWQADMLVMGNSSRSVLLRKVLGDTLLATLRDTEIPLFLAQ